MALALEPALLIADEPTTALDVTTQAQILRLIREIQDRRGMAVIFITHDFGVVRDIADRVLVLEKGVVVEQGTAAEVLQNPQHPYTQALLAAVPAGAPPERPAPAADVVLSVKGLEKTFRLQHAGSSCRSGRCAPSATSPSTCTGARRWGSSARAARASRPSRAW